MADLVNHPGMFLNDQAAASLKRLEDDHGVQPVTSAGRYKETQQALIDRWDKGGIFNRPPYLYEPARPPEESAHVKNKGEAVDVINWKWWRENAWRYGWVVDFDWDVVHFRYDISKDMYLNREVIEKKKDWFEMATKEDLDNALREANINNPDKAVTIGVPDGEGGQVYWSVNYSAGTMYRVWNGSQLEIRRNLGIREEVNQAPQVLEGLVDTTPYKL